MREMGVIIFTVCIQFFPPLFMSMFRFCLRLVTMNVKVLILNYHHYHILFYIE